MIQPNPTFSAIQIALRRKRTNKRQLLTAIASCEKAFAHIEALEADLEAVRAEMVARAEREIRLVTRLTAERDEWKHEAESLKWWQRALSAEAHIEVLEAVVEAAKAVGGLTSTEVILSVSEPEVVERIDAGLKQLSVALQRLQERE